MMNNTIITIKKELRSTLRDKKSLLMMLLTPLFIPLFVFLFSYMFDDIEQKADTETFTIGITYELSEVEHEILHVLRLNTISKDEEYMYEAFQNGELNAYIILRDDTYHIYFNPQEVDSNVAGQLVLKYLEQFNNYKATNYLIENKINPENVFNIIAYEVHNVKGKSMFIDQIVTMAFVFAIMSITMSANYAATDSTAGEKERGTLETLLTFPIKTKSLISGKYIAIFLACVITAILCGILMTVSLMVASNMFSIYEVVTIDISATTIVLSAVILLAFAVFISGVSIAVASLSKTYKEAQSALTPISMLPMIPMFMGMIGIQLTHFIAAIPIVNHVMLLNDLFTGRVDNTNILIMFASTVIFTIFVIIYIGKQYKSEKVLFNT